MLLIVVILIGCMAVRTLPMLLVEAVATVMMVGQVLSRDRMSRVLIDPGFDRARGMADWDRRPTAAERKVLRRGLRVAIQQTDSNSLFPHIALRTRQIADALRR